MISKTMRAILHTLSYGNIEVESSRRLVDIKKLDAMNIFLKKMDIQIFNEDYEIPLRIYFPTEEAMTNGVEKGHTVKPRRPSSADSLKMLTVQFFYFFMAEDG